jgi:protein-ribulosamine 3-kinase
MTAAEAESGSVGADGLPLRYMPRVRQGDPVCDAAVAVTARGARVARFELLDSRWNGNEAMRYDVVVHHGDDRGPHSSSSAQDGGAGHPNDDPPTALAPKASPPSAATTTSSASATAKATAAAATDCRPVFAKLNRVEHPQVFMAEAVSLTSLISAAPSVLAPRPLHIGKLPRVGDFGPGAFMLLQWFDLVPFGASRPEVQRGLGQIIADIHTSSALDHVHKGRFGFTINNFLALTPMDNTWGDKWPVFFAKRLQAQVDAAFKNKPYGRAPLDLQKDEDLALKILAKRIIAGMDAYFENCSVTPSLLHGDLWIGNVGATRESKPVIYDPASFFGHSEFDLALMRMFGGYTDNFWDVYFARVPKARGFEIRSSLYEMYQYLNQLNLFGDPQVRAKIFAHAQTLVDFLD